MIPKTIHYIWLSDDPLNEVAEKCVESWEETAPDFQIKRWKMSDFDFEQMPEWVNEAVSVKKWAFACDYLRLYVLEKEGGFYLDSDVFMVKPIDSFLKHRFVSAVEYYPDLFADGVKCVDENGCSEADAVDGMAIQAAIMGSEPGHPYLRRVMAFYENNHFILPDGSLNNKIIAPQIFARAARVFGFRYFNRYQELDEGITLYESSVFAPGYKESNQDSVLIHLCTGSWRDMSIFSQKASQSSNKRNINNVIDGEKIRSESLLLTIKIIIYRVLNKLFG